MAGFASGIVVVAAVDADGRPIGVAVRSFMALPGDEPMVAVALPSTSRTLQPLLAHGQFGVSVLAAPLVDDSISTLTCALERELSTGEHVVVLGRVVEGTLHVEAGRPLLYHHGALLQQGVEANVR